MTLFQSSIDERVSSKYMTALALATSDNEDDPVCVDFFHKTRPHFLFNQKTLIKAAACLSIAGIINFGALHFQKEAIEKQIKQVQKEISNNEIQLKNGPVMLPEGKNPQEIITLTENRITLLKRTKLSTVRTVYEAIKCIKDTPVTLMSLQVKPDQVIMEAQAESIAISDKLKQNLSASSFFSDVKYEKFNQTGPVSKRMHHFSLEFARTETVIPKG